MIHSKVSSKWDDKLRFKDFVPILKKKLLILPVFEIPASHVIFAYNQK